MPEIQQDVSWAVWYARGHAMASVWNTYDMVVVLTAQRCGSIGICSCSLVNSTELREIGAVPSFVAYRDTQKEQRMNYKKRSNRHPYKHAPCVSTRRRVCTRRLRAYPQVSGLL